MVLHTYRLTYINIVTSTRIQLNTQNIGSICYPQLHEPCTIFTYFMTTLILLWMQKREQVRPCLLNTETQRVCNKPQVGTAETVGNSKLKSSCKAEEKITKQKTN